MAAPSGHGPSIHCARSAATSLGFRPVPAAPAPAPALPRRAQPNPRHVAARAGAGAVAAAVLRRRGFRLSRLTRRALRSVSELRHFRSSSGEEFELFADDVLGAGAQGTVYGGQVKKTGERVAIKVIPTWRLVLEEAGMDKMSAIEDEFATLQAVGSHPNIAGMRAVVDIFSEGTPAHTHSVPHYKLLVMERVEGRELAEHVAVGGPMLESKARHIFLQVLDGLKHMHGRGVIHRDLKPENVLVTGREVTLESHVKLIDFGVAKCLNSGPMRTIVGTPSFMAPEVAMAKIRYGACAGPSEPKRHAFAWGSTEAAAGSPGGTGQLVTTQRRLFCPKIDVWSAGVVLFTCLTGKLPFKSELEIIESDYLRGPLSHCSEEAKDLLAGMLEKKAEERLSIAECVEHPWIACSEDDVCTINWEALQRDF